MKILRSIILVLLLVPVFLSLPTVVQGEEQNEVVEVYLHKRLFRDWQWRETQPDAVNQWHYDNQGTQLTDMQQTLTDELLSDPSLPLNGAIFKVYDFTPEYQKALAAGQTPVTFAQDFADRTYALEQIQALHKVPLTNPEATGSTEAATSFITARTGVPDESGTPQPHDGIIHLQLAPTQAGLASAYLILETGLATTVSVDLTQKAFPLMLTFPLAVETEGQALHLYPKNVSYLRSPYFYKVDAQLKAQAPLTGAKFVLYRQTADKKEYLAEETTTTGENTWVTKMAASPLSDARLAVFASDQTGLVDTDSHFLPAGTYYFEEVQAPTGYQLSAASKEIPVVIPPTWDTLVTVNGQVMAERIAGEIPLRAQESKTPQVINSKTAPPIKPDTTLLPITPLPPTPSTPVTSPTPVTATPVSLPDTKGQSPLLPRTGSTKTGFWLIGLSLIITAIALWKHRLRKGQ